MSDLEQRLSDLVWEYSLDEVKKALAQLEDRAAERQFHAGDRVFPTASNE